MGGITQVHVEASDNTREQILQLFVVEFLSSHRYAPGDFAALIHWGASGLNVSYS